LTIDNLFVGLRPEAPNLVISPLVTTWAARANAAKTETGAPLCRRQLWQWDHATHFGRPVPTRRTAPHMQPASN